MVLKYWALGVVVMMRASEMLVEVPTKVAEEAGILLLDPN
jgi:hypothetical protein